MIWHCSRNACRSSGLDLSNVSGAQVQVCVNGTGASICGGRFCGVDWPKVIKVHRRFCIISSTFVTAAARGGIWGVGGWEMEGWGGACPWLGEGQGMIEGQVLGRVRWAKVSGDGPIIS